MDWQGFLVEKTLGISSEAQLQEIISTLSEAKTFLNQNSVQKLSSSLMSLYVNDCEEIWGKNLKCSLRRLLCHSGHSLPVVFPWWRDFILGPVTVKLYITEGQSKVGAQLFSKNIHSHDSACQKAEHSVTMSLSLPPQTSSLSTT